MLWFKIWKPLVFFFFSLISSKINHFDLKHFKLKHTGTFKSSQIAGNEWDLNCIVVDCVMLQPSPSWIWGGGGGGGGRVGTQNIVKKERRAGIPVLWVCMEGVHVTCALSMVIKPTDWCKCCSGWQFSLFELAEKRNKE